MRFVKLLAAFLLVPFIAHANVTWTTYGNGVLAQFPIYAETGVTCASITNATASLQIGIFTDVSTSITEYTGSNIETVGTASGGLDAYGTGSTSGKVAISPKETSGCYYVLQIPSTWFATANASSIFYYVTDGGTAMMTTTGEINMQSASLDDTGQAVVDTSCSGAAAGSMGGACLLATPTHTAVTVSIPADLDTVAAANLGKNLWSGTLVTLTGQTEFEVTSLPTDADHTGRSLCAVAADFSTSRNAGCATIASMDAGTDVITLDDEMPFPLAEGDYLFVPEQDVRVAAMAANTVTAAAAAPDLATELQSGLATASAVSGVQSDTDNLQTRIPASLVSGRIDASVGAMAANTMTAAAANPDLTTELQTGLATSSALATVATNVDDILVDTATTLPGLVGEVANDAAEAVFDTVIDGLKFECWVATDGAMLSGRSAKSGSTYTYKRHNNAANRAAITVNASNERTTVAITCP